MTVLSLQWRPAWPRLWAVLTRRPPAACRPTPAEGRTYHDSLFADPAIVEDDYRRMSHRGVSAR